MAEQTVIMVDSDGYEYIIGKETGITYGSTNPEWQTISPLVAGDTVVGIARRDEQGRLIVEVMLSATHGDSEKGQS